MRTILITGLALCLFVSGCNNLVDKSVQTTTTTTTKTIKVPNKPDVVIVIVVVILKKFDVIDKGFTVGTQGLGTYYFSLIRDLSFM